MQYGITKNQHLTLILTIFSNMELSERIQQLVDYSGMNVPQLSMRLGFKTPQTLRELLKGNTKTISDAVLLKVQKGMPEVSTEWLLHGTPPMIIEVDDNNSSSTASKELHLIPFYDAETTGGYNDAISSSNNDVSLKGYINAGDWFDSRETAAIRHVGNSMVEYPDGCILAVREVKERRLLVPGQNYVIETDEYRITKRMQKGSSDNTIALYSSNKEKYEDGRLIYEPFEVNIDDVRRIFSILGYVVNQNGQVQFVRS